MAVQHRQQHGQAIAVQAHTQAPGRRPAAVHQSLNFYQQGACAFQRDHDTTAGDRLGVLAQENGTRVADALEPLLGHRKHANFVDRTKAVFDGAHQVKA